MDNNKFNPDHFVAKEFKKTVNDFIKSNKLDPDYVLAMLTYTLGTFIGDNHHDFGDKDGSHILGLAPIAVINPNDVNDPRNTVGVVTFTAFNPEEELLNQLNSLEHSDRMNEIAVDGLGYLILSLARSGILPAEMLKEILSTLSQEAFDRMSKENPELAKAMAEFRTKVEQVAEEAKQTRSKHSNKIH